MGLVAPLQSGGIPSRSESGDKPITSADIAVAAKDTFINRTSIVPETYPDIYGTLLRYTEGVPTIVEYFRKRVPYINKQTVDTSFSLERGAVHSSFDLVHNFEIRIKDQLDIQVDPDTAETRISGEAVIYPGLIPNPGDLFYMGVPDNRIGIFIVNSSIPLSIHKGTHHLISFELYSYISTQIDEKIRASVVDELWFDKQKYFDDEACLLSDTSYRQLTTLVRTRTAISSYLMNNFYDTANKTIVRPDSKYDSYLVMFLTNKISVRDSPRDLTQIVSQYSSAFDNSIWHVLLTQDLTRLVYTGYTLNKYVNHLWDAGLSNLDKYPIVTLCDQHYEIKKTDRLIPVKLYPDDTEYRIASYAFSNRLYYALIASFENTTPIDDIVPLLQAMEDDPRVFANAESEYYSPVDDAYHAIDFFNVHNTSTGSNNNIHIPELEFLIFDFIVNDSIDIPYLTSILGKFPFAKMKPVDRVYYMPVLLHLCDMAITRIR